MRRAGRGFTLVELMVTLAVLGALLVVSIPMIRDWLLNTEIRNAAESVTEGLTKARAEAVKRNENVVFSLVSNTGHPGTLTGDCQLSTQSASWVVSIENPAGQCGQAAGPGNTDTPLPRILYKHARGDGSPGVTAEVRDADCQSTTGNAQIVFNGYGRAQPQPAPLRCVVIRHPGSATSRTLAVMVNVGGTVRTCDPAVTAPAGDPRICRITP